MRTPTATPTTTNLSDSSGAIEDIGSQSGVDPLSGFDAVQAAVAQKTRQSAEHSAHELDDQQDFVVDFETVCQREVRPAMQAVLERLHRNGGGGTIEEHPGGEARVRTPRLTLWMSLEGEIEGLARPDRHPYLQLDADVAERQVEISEGDMWRGAGGGHSGRIGSWQLSDVHYDRIVDELLNIAHRSGR